MSAKVEIPIYMSSVNHLEVKGHVNGIECRFLLDTGFTGGFAIESKLAEKLALTASVGPMKSYCLGKEMDVMFAEVAEMKLGNFVLRRAWTGLLDLSGPNIGFRQARLTPIDGLIGGEFFSQFSAIIDYHELKLKFRMDEQVEPIGGA